MKQENVQRFFNQFNEGNIAFVQGLDLKKVGDIAIQIGTWGDDRKRYPLLPNHVEAVIEVNRDKKGNVIKIKTLVADGEKVRESDFIKEHENQLLKDEARWVVGALVDLVAIEKKTMINYWHSLNGKDYDKKAIAIIGAHEIPLLGFFLGPIVDMFLRQEKDKYICSEHVEEGIAEIKMFNGKQKYNTKKNNNEIPTPKSLFVNLTDTYQLKIIADSILMTYI